MAASNTRALLQDHGLSVAEVPGSVRVLLIAALLLYPMVYLGMYAGDAEIHLVYGANAAHGGFFEFNRGEPSAGVTSPGFMLMIAGLFRYLPAAVVPLVVKAICLLAWYGLSFTVFRLARGLGLAGVWAWVAACVAGVIPGSAYNATIGMENGIFALAVLGWLNTALVTGWFDDASANSERLVLRTVWKEGLLGGALGLVVWLRPEGFVVGILALVHRAFRFGWAGAPRCWTLMRSIATGIPFVLLTGLFVAFLHAYTGHFLPASGRARVLMGSLDAFWFGPVAINTNVIERLLAYFPLTIAWVIGTAVVLKGRVVVGSMSVAAECLILVASTFFVLYSTLLGSAHLARYLLFVMPLFVLVAILGARWLWELPGPVPFVPGRPSGRVGVLVMVTVLGIVFAIETRERLWLGSRDEVLHAVRAPAERGSFSDALYRALGAPAGLPIVVAYQEVQVRYWLDDRFVVRSLDGRTDPVMLDFASPVRFDHVGYIKARGIRFVMELPNYNHDPDAWSLQELDRLAPSERLVHEGLVFSRLPGDEVIIRVESAR